MAAARLWLLDAAGQVADEVTAQLPSGHVEAGLRTDDRYQPFPEEMNRVLVDHISDVCFAPTKTAAAR